MRNKISAGLLMYRYRSEQLEVLLVHPGGPFSSGKDEDHWSIPKGEIQPGEDLLQTAKREFMEEVGLEARGMLIELGTIRQKSGKIVHGWALHGEENPPNEFRCNTFRLEWPPGSRRIREFPEIDLARFMPIPEARRKLKAAQCAFLDRLEAYLQKQNAEFIHPQSIDSDASPQDQLRNPNPSNL
ncbi:MAG TPA: NUDIX domain-containing protein [Candidatus Paceibacterota bacterium]|nr:NUDIX domain-containing protein [Verrucomicrobiota bacterium]HRY46807.1 NUDIX domain-containing protein [Candidatus Paceibacterota bacterium]HSA00508.1 NUDIX domain-containing protein [Candidatus Paceibacterota bacterium]